MTRAFVIIVAIFICASLVNAQQSTIPLAPWRLLSYNGNLNANGTYYKSFFEQAGEQNYGYQYSVGGFISTQSYVYHPNLLTLTVSGGYQPQFGEVVSSQVPDYVTGLSLLQYSINANFFKTFDYKVNAYYNYVKKNSVNLFFDRDITEKKWGANITYDKDYKIKTHFEHNNTNDYDNLTDRELLLSNTFLRGSMIKSFFKKDRNELSFNFERTASESFNLFKNSTDLFYANYNNLLYLNKKQSIPLNSSVIFSDQKGTFNMKNIGFNENLILPIAKKLNFTTGFGMRKTERESQLTKEQNLKGNLSYGIYNSLQNNLNVSYNNVDQVNNYNLENKSIAFSTAYGKKIPSLKGNLRIHYSYEYQDQNRTNEESSFTIFNEEHVLQDGTIVLLNSSNAIIESVVVKDITGTIIYQENFDYILIQRGINIEIQRLVGSTILNNTAVLIDYNTLQNASYDFSGKGNEFGTALQIFDNLLLLEYKYAKKNYIINSGNENELGLNNFIFNSYGAHLNYNIYRGGVVYEDNASTVLPYKLWRYYFNASKSFSRKMRINFDARIDDYTKYFNEGDSNKLSTLSSDIAYNINYRTRLVFNVSYAEQKGDLQNYQLISGRGEIRKIINQLEFSLSVKYFNRKVPNLVGSSNFLGVNFRIQRNF
ncbi:hypothetical protein [Aestuariivivens sediminis]|uniref:hypothetical protein n=1 Tax=Aestuariivivens sediminis TaxID=2913557 RepID=UPI001F56942C|nr:hypothetical protein [Aestuariivivens sediminis]